jgi:AcrR family transcriptional regulator
MTRTPHRQDGSARREALLDAALICFARAGVLNVGIEEIRTAAAASPSSMYHFFPAGLADLTAALLERIFAGLFAQLAEQVRAKRTARSAVEALVGGHLDWVFAHRAEARVMYQAVGLHYPQEVQTRLVASKQRAIAPLLELLLPFVHARELPDWPPDLLDVVLVGPSHEACRRWLMGADLDPRWLRKTLPELAWRSLQK